MNYFKLEPEKYKTQRLALSPDAISKKVLKRQKQIYSKCDTTWKVSNIDCKIQVPTATVVAKEISQTHSIQPMSKKINAPKVEEKSSFLSKLGLIEFRIH